jgi:thiamine pyrophosphokinase
VGVAGHQHHAGQFAALAVRGAGERVDHALQQIAQQIRLSILEVLARIAIGSIVGLASVSSSSNGS